MVRFLAVCVLLCMAQGADAADHVDGPETAGNRHGDLADIYAFPANGDRSLAVVLNVHPFRSRLDSLSLETLGFATAGLDHDITLRIAMRELEIGGEPSALEPEADGYVLTCTFAKAQTLTCSDTDGRSFETPFDEIGEADGAKIFFGKAADPFFFDAEWALCVTRFGETSVLDREIGKNTLNRQNLFSLVFEVPVEKLFDGSAALVGIVGESLVDGEPYDRVGRPELTNVLMPTRYVPEKVEDLRDSFNRLPSFTDVDPAYGARIAETVRLHDAMVPPLEWTDAQVDHFAAVMAADFLSIDLNRLDACYGDPFLDIELEMILGNPGSHRTCGGRRFRDDVMDSIYRLLFARGGAHAPVDQVFLGQLAFRDSFPYVPEPHFISLGSPAQIILATSEAADRPDLCD
ncbi:MAG: DUF4331 family protein [Pseudomonadota bacterium]